MMTGEEVVVEKRSELFSITEIVLEDVSCDCYGIKVEILRC